ncbi:D-alanyl-D-alanine carboxypeptidase [Saccharothrix saharensis]|uniref:D-alanyl-D-alanine carboxypeptidase n=1 Tax=Saccharothrix saharensis TaxID=571190 RepID=A0A543JH22_9PSEU|nr:serine hydrolase domain-containing protein [Saccharothrix saharensis]TQM82143.1 D-alanyl-D-alanine carboxypeptidase [Saccharothrix saharensis]
MRTLLRTTTAAVLAAALVGTAAGPASATDRLTDLAEELVAAGAPGVIVRVDDGRRVTEFASQAPWTRRDHRLRPDDRFRVASNTKTVTATIALQLVAEGRLALADPVERWLPGVVPNGGAITVEMLLKQTSGLYDFLDDPRLVGLITGQEPRRWRPAELVAVAVEHPPLFAPGERWDYSNTNYTLAGMVLESASGVTYGELVARRVTGPLRLTDTHLPTDATFPGRHAHGYEPDAEHLAPHLPPGTPPGLGFAGPEHHDHVDVTGIDVSPAWAAGGMTSTARDWQRFQSALLSGRLLPREQLRAMLATVPQDAGTDRYGLGVMEVGTPCGTVWGHTGGLPGYSTHAFADRTGTRTVTVLTTRMERFAPENTAVEQALFHAAVCRMYGR